MAEAVAETQFVPGLVLNRGFFHEVIKPLMQKAYPHLEYSVSLIGYGSDVLGFDNRTSMDHNWGPRCQLFFDDRTYLAEINEYLGNALPFVYRGFSVNFSDERFDKTRSMEAAKSGPVKHLIEVTTLQDYLPGYLKTGKTGGFDTKEWLVFQDQALLELVSGEVFHDGLNKLERLREELAFYPEDIHKLRLAALWKGISEEEAFVGRCMETGDFIGLKMIVSRIVNALVKIVFYLEHKYIPYSKWFGSAFKKLDSYNAFFLSITETLSQNDTGLITEHLCSLYTLVTEKHNGCKNLPHLDHKIVNYYGRPYKVLFAGNIADTLLNSIRNKDLQKINLKNYALDIKISAPVDSVEVKTLFGDRIFPG